MKTKQQKIELLRKKPGRIDGHAHVGCLYRNYLQFAYPYCMSFEDLVYRMKYFGTEYSVIFGMDSSYYSIKTDKGGKVKTNEDFSTFPYELENQNLVKEVYEIFPEFSDRVFPFLLFDPSRKAKEQANHLDKLCKTFPIFGLKTIPTYIQAFIKDIDTVGKPILDVVKKHNLSMTFHCSCHKEDPWANVFDIIHFAEKNPDLRICLAHAARFVKKVLDRADKLPNCFVDLSAFNIHCDLAVRNRQAVAPKKERFDADYSNPKEVIKELSKSYPDTLIWGTDVPYNYFIQKVYHADGKGNEVFLKSSFDEEFEILKAVPKKLAKIITYENTLRFICG